MRILWIRYILIIAIGTGLLVSCSTPRHFQREAVKTDGLYGDSATTDTTNMVHQPWREIFTESYLQKLIQEGINNNPDLQIAIQRVLEAEAYFSQNKAALLPDISAKATGAYIHNPAFVNPTSPSDVSSFQLGLEASWEVDLWGKLRRSKRAAYANLLASDAGRKAVQTRLVASIATVYYTLTGLDEQLAITQQTVKNNIDLVETLKVLMESGRVTGAAVVQSEAARYAAEVTIPDLKLQILENENALCLLVGRVPGHIERGKIDQQSLTSALYTGVPAQLLVNRPDVMQADFALRSAFETTNSARAYFYPALTLTASSGFVATDLNNLLDPQSFAANIIAGLTQPIFNRKINATRLKVARAQQQEALINFRNALLIAGQEVQNALGSYKTSVEKIKLRQLQLDALNKSVDFTKELLTYSSSTYIEVLNAQTNLLIAQLNNINDRLQQLDAVVTLYRALGGGWK